jgi:hypothetical protein
MEMILSAQRKHTKHLSGGVSGEEKKANRTNRR